MVNIPFEGGTNTNEISIPLSFVDFLFPTKYADMLLWLMFSSPLKQRDSYALHFFSSYW